jgi:hypothetical protein
VLTCCKRPLRRKSGRVPRADEKPQRVIASGLWSSARYLGISSSGKREGREESAPLPVMLLRNGNQRKHEDLCTVVLRFS